MKSTLIDGDGFGNGTGDGDGNGNGIGDGFGIGTGDGDGDGDGFGHGHGASHLPLARGLCTHTDDLREDVALVALAPWPRGEVLDT